MEFNVSESAGKPLFPVETESENAMHSLGFEFVMCPVFPKTVSLSLIEGPRFHCVPNIVYRQLEYGSADFAMSSFRFRLRYRYAFISCRICG